MNPIDHATSRRSAVKSLFASIAGAAAAIFGTSRAPSSEAAETVRLADEAQASDAPAPLFSSAVVHGGLVFIAGKGEHGPGDIVVHTKSVLDQLEAELKKAGSSMEKVLKVNVYLHDIRDFEGMNQAYRGRFGAKPPVRTTIAAYGGIPGQSLVEIDCIAAL